MNWLIIIILIVLAFVFLRAKHIKHKVFLISLILVILFLYFTASRILSDYNINWKSVSGIEKAVKVYFIWLGGAFDNFKVITGNAINMDWRITNKTETDKVIEKE